MSFEYARPTSLIEAATLLRRDDAAALAGGTDLLVAIRHRKSRPALVVDVKSIEELTDEITVTEGHLRIGGRVVMSEVIASDRVQSHFPALVDAASVVGSVQIRNRATLAGNLSNASPAADTAPVLLAHRARVVVSDGVSERVIPLSGFFVGPGSTALARGELITAVEIPIPDGPVGDAFARVTRRRGVDLASVNLGCAVDITGAVRFGMGAVAPTPIFAESTLGELADSGAWDDLLSVANPISDVRAGADYRRAMLAIHARRALQVARDRLDARGSR